MTLTPVSAFIRIIRDLHKAQLTAKTPEDRALADDELTHFLSMSHNGQFEAWLASRPQFADDAPTVSDDESFG